MWWGGVPGGGWPATVVRGVWCQALSLPRLPVLWAGCRGPLPTGCGCGGVRAWGPITNPTDRALASCLCALWGRREGARGGAPPAWVWGVRGRALSHPRVPALWAGCRGPLPTGCACGGVRAWGPVTNPTARALACCGGGIRVPGGGASCLGVGRPGSGALPTPTARRLGGLPGPTTHWLWVRGGAGVGTCHQPHSARSCELALRAVGAARGRPGGAPPAWVWGVRGRALSQPRLPALCAGCRGPLPTGCGCGGVRAWGPVTSPTARAHASWLCPLWGRHEGARGGRPLPGCGASGAGRSPSLDCPPSWRAAGAHYPLPAGAGRLRAWGPVTNLTARALANWLCAVWGRHEGARGGRPLPWCGASVVGRSPTPTCPPSGRAAGAHYPLAVGAGGCGRGDPSPAPQRALLRAGFARCGGGIRVPGGGACCLGVGRPGSGALPPPSARPLGGLLGPTTHWLWVWGGAGVGTRHQPHSARSCELALCAVGAARGGPRGGASCLGVGRTGSGALPPPTARPQGGLPGPTTHWLRVRGVRAWGPVTNPTARALASWLCALWGRHEGARGGASCLGVGRPGSGVLRPPTARPLSGLPGPTTHWLWVPGGAGVGTRHEPHSARSFELALRAVGAARGRRGGDASCLSAGRPRSGALPPPTARPLGRLPGPITHWLWERGGAGVGTRHKPHCARSCELALRAVEAT